MRNNPFLIEAQNALLYAEARDPNSGVNTLDFAITGTGDGIAYVKQEAGGERPDATTATHIGTSWDYIGVEPGTLHD